MLLHAHERFVERPAGELALGEFAHATLAFAAGIAAPMWFYCARKNCILVSLTSEILNPIRQNDHRSPAEADAIL